MTEYLDKWDGDIIRALRFQDEEICEFAANEIERLRAALQKIVEIRSYRKADAGELFEIARAALTNNFNIKENEHG
jgi:hypothetical protein